ncbi:hypothetical protein GCM10009609_32960 [Pseudonocardia aurantiaca]|uniref:Uncharacterized protein n=1 Tax=Pseudonocardia aurantiaca TaxID=75290 RepID=A0ABW4FR41_9PSEU
MTTTPTDVASTGAASTGEAAVLRTLAASPPHGVQVHIRTDLFSTGMALFGSVVELDFLFTGPGREQNAFNSLLP